MPILLTICFVFLPILIGLTIFGILNEWNSAFVVQILQEMNDAIIGCVQPDHSGCYPVYEPIWELYKDGRTPTAEELEQWVKTDAAPDAEGKSQEREREGGICATSKS